ncbi:Dicarboxylate transport [Oceanospirillum multiglobuliferum]|uniref:Uncharacterized protein n=1 Tax=Oceanospirillum multiglobuliferum TaxID=64969 RepID=A0A1T4SG51_9GAMM|nr:YdbH domain-containing protein [Oceanospirillum multiglobuliferum]OPX54303.1 hypothetical protein BTE48_15035 [Oceanospirillum multiglobuliferum]SKA26888.1 Dicarboxylate transport [Oceanospirillum multiglobuliferum]
MDQLRLNMLYLLMRLRKWIFILSGLVLILALLLLSLWLTRAHWLPSVVNYGVKEKGWQLTELSWSEPYQIDRLSLAQAKGQQFHFTAIHWQKSQGLLHAGPVVYQAGSTPVAAPDPTMSVPVSPPADFSVMLAQRVAQINQALEDVRSQLVRFNDWAAWVGLTQIQLPDVQVRLADSTRVQLDLQINQQQSEWRFGLNATTDLAPEYALALNGQLNTDLMNAQLQLNTPPKGQALSKDCHLKAGEPLQLDVQIPLQAFGRWQLGLAGVNLRHSANCLAELIPTQQANFQAPKAGWLQVSPISLRLDLARQQLLLPNLKLNWQANSKTQLAMAKEVAVAVQPTQIEVDLTEVMLSSTEQKGRITTRASFNAQGNLVESQAEKPALLAFNSSGYWRNSAESFSYQSAETHLQTPALKVQEFQLGVGQLNSPVSLLWQKANGLLQLAASVHTTLNVKHALLKKPLALVLQTELSGTPQQPHIQLQSLTPELPLLVVLNSDALALNKRATPNTAKRVYIFSTAPIMLSNWAQMLKLPEDLLLSDGRLQFNGALNLNAVDLSQSSGQFDLGLEQGGGRYLGYQWSGLSVPLNVHYQGQSQPLLLRANQLFLQRLWAGVELQNLRMNLNAEHRKTEAGTMFTGQVSALQGDLWGGRFNLDQLSYPIPEQGVDSLVSLRQLDLQKLVNASNEQKIRVTGSVSGRLPLKLYADGVEIKQGMLESDTNGVISLKNNPAWQLMLQQQATLASSLRHLNYLDYTQLRGHLEMARSGNLKVELQIEGENKAENQPVNFNFNSEQNILTLLKALRLTQQLNDSLDNRMKRKTK